MAVLKTAFAAAKAMLDHRVTENRLTTLGSTDGPWLELDIRTNAQGRQVLHFNFMVVSDIHLATRQSRARRTSHMLEHTEADRFYVDGDIPDGLHMVVKEKAHIAPWHRQVMAHILRKLGTYIPGNHDIELRGKKLEREGKEVWHRKLTGKTVYGLAFADEAIYQDPKGRKFRIAHGDGFDDVIFGNNKKFWYSFGDLLYTVFTNADTLIQSIPRLDGYSIAAKGKKIVKTIINEFMGVNKEITRATDNDPNVDGLIYGHSHMGDLTKTPNGKPVFNSGCCTEHVQALVHDRHGTFALITWHKNSLEILEESGRARKFTWSELGLDSFKAAPTLVEDECTKKADRLIRLMDRMWPSRQRQQEIHNARVQDRVPSPISLPHPFRGKRLHMPQEALNAA